MIINDHIESKALCQYFFVEGVIDVDSTYFINKIKEGIEREDNNNFKTNVRDKITSYKYFNSDEKFISIIKKLSKYVDDTYTKPYDLNLYGLISSWGYCISKDHKTRFHDHAPFIWSGVIYLNDHSQCLEFPAINKKIKPEKGKFVLFSSFLKHGTKRNESEETKWGLSFNMSPVNIINIEKDKL